MALLFTARPHNPHQRPVAPLPGRWAIPLSALLLAGHGLSLAAASLAEGDTVEKKAASTLRCQTFPLPTAHSGWQSCAGALQGAELAVDAPAGQLLLWTLDGGTHAHQVQLHGPDGALLRQWPAVHNGAQDLGWITPLAGTYRLRADKPYFTQEAADAPPMQWRLRANGPARADSAAAALATPAATPPASPLLLQLQEQLALASKAQKADLIQSFWQTVQARGTPLLEALPHPQEALATFLWRAPAGTADQAHAVRLDWAMRSADTPRLQQLPGTDIWQLSLPLPRGLRAAYQLVVDPVRHPAAEGQALSRMQQMQTQQLAAQRDALNPHVWHAGNPALSADSAAARHAQRSALDIPASGALHNQASNNPLPALNGQLQHLRFASSQLGNTRSLSLYLPPGTHTPASLPLLLLFDREAYLERVQLPQRLEGWIAQGQILPMAVLLVANPTREDRAKELPPHSDAFGRMLATELLPWLRARTPALARNASQVVVAGSSYGGLASGYLGWAHPEAFGNVLSLSGSYWWAPTPPTGQAAHRWSEGDWFMQQVARSPTRPVRWHLGYGLLERGVNGEGGLVDNNRHLRNVLQAKGYTVSSDEFAGGHDYYAWDQAILRGLQALGFNGPAAAQLTKP
ncbi:alpha/beta hydrolase [Comamonas sp. GB3 AK4-5]|uniref:alpha/beta hydrolase n=1 Tax=Comamonas sp. GB3 AK4-5 TaxID=3231487 RepID=UPI00351F0734